MLPAGPVEPEPVRVGKPMSTLPGVTIILPSGLHNLIVFKLVIGTGPVIGGPSGPVADSTKNRTVEPVGPSVPNGPVGPVAPVGPGTNL